jgi:hypothetical protein
MEIIEVIDTAVKVGLGAAISGFTTYAISLRNHKSEKMKEETRKRVEMLTFSLESIDNYLNCLYRCFSTVNGIHQQGPQPEGKMPDHLYLHCKTKDDLLIESRTDRAAAISRFHLLGLTEALEIIKSLNTVEKKFRNEVMFRKTLPSDDEMLSMSRQLNEHREKLYKVLEKAFNKVYK